MGMSDETSSHCRRHNQGGSQQSLDAYHTPEAHNLTLPWSLSTAHYPLRHGNELTPYFSGEEVFAEIAKSIQNAKKSVDIIAWGFDPAMPIVRKDFMYTWENAGIDSYGNLSHYSPWRQQDSYGQILLDALRINRELRIRVVLWYCRPVKAAYNLGSNIIGMPNSIISNLVNGNLNKLVSIDPSSEKDTGFDPRYFHGKVNTLPRHPDAQVYSKQWFDHVKAGSVERFPYLERLGFCFRSIKFTSLTEEDPTYGLEQTAFENTPSDHQKTILIDFEDPANRHGYLMGHNGLTPYWSRFPFVHRDIASEMDYAPYHDFSMRIRGPLLIDMNENFCDAWESRYQFEDTGLFKFETILTRKAALESADELRETRRKLYSDMEKATPVGTASGQILRTRPDNTHDDGTQEKDIKDIYLLVTRHATNYILIVNQYCQYAKLMRHIKYWWNQRRQGGLDRKLYILMGTCKPERAGQVFRAQQMANEIGVGLQFTTATHEMYYEENDPRRAREKESTDLIRHRYGYSPHPTWKPDGDRTTYGADMNADEDKNTPAILEKMGIYPLFFMFYTQIPDYPGAGNIPENRIAQQVYVHAKLMVMDDIFTTLGSANLNTRSMAVDSEINLATSDLATAQKFRKTLWAAYSGIDGVTELFPNVSSTLQQDNIKQIYETLTKIAKDNAKSVKKTERIQGLIAQFDDARSVRTARLG